MMVQRTVTQRDDPAQNLLVVRAPDDFRAMYGCIASMQFVRAVFKAGSLMMKIVHIEDDEVSRRALKRTLSIIPGRHKLLQAGSLAEGLTSIKSHSPGLVLLDLLLPDSDDPVSSVQRVMPAACKLVVLSGAHVRYAAQRARGHQVYSKSRMLELLSQGGALRDLVQSLSDQ